MSIMAKKIPFHVVFATDEEISYPASELNNHGPTVLGWRSALDSTITPHDIILRFHKAARICRIQILAHQYLIPEKVELWLHYSPKSIPSTPSSQCFDFLGFVALSDNSATNYKSRELQSITVTPRKGTHLKLRLSSAHQNKFNSNGQIALLAINVLGETIRDDTSEDNPTIDAQKNGVQSCSSTSSTDYFLVDPTTGEPILASYCDDLLFSMYVEESIAETIRELDAKKAKAVSDERFEYARKLKLCMSSLRTAGERLGRYALAKRQAVQQEDFTTAKLRKEQIEMYKTTVLEYLKVNDLLETNGKSLSINDMTCDIYASKPTLPPPPSLQDVAHALSEAHNICKKNAKGAQGDNATTHTHTHSYNATHLRKSHDEIPMSPRMNARRSPSRTNSPMSSRQGSLRRRNKSVPRNSYEDYEERAIPTLRHSHTNEFLRECQGNALLETDTSRGRSFLNDRERRQAALPILVFGNELVELFYSRQFQDREDGLIRLRDFLKDVELENNENNTSANKVARAAALLLHRSVRDAVYSVFSQATETVRVLFLEFLPNRVSQSEVARCVDRLLPELLAKSGDPSARINTIAQHTILSIAACPEVMAQHLVAPALSRTVSSGTHPRLALSRMQMLEQLVLSQGISADKHSGLTCRVLSECGCSGIHHPAEPVRKVAERILLLVYKVNPRLVRKQLPPDDDITRRNLLYRQLFTEFDKLDLMRKKEMLETNKFSGNGSSLSASPPSGHTCPDHSVLGYVHRNSNSPDIPNPIRKTNKHSHRNRSEERCVQNFENTSNGPTTHKSKQQYNEEVQRSMKSICSKPKDTHSSSISESAVATNVIRCPFCDWSCHGLDQTQLDRHYWKSCPFLTKCPQCSQVLEVAALNYHLTQECETKDSYRTCDRCTESVHKQLFELHQMEDYCRELVQGAARCPLCHDDVHVPLDGGWKAHLLDNNGCPGNTRRRFKLVN